MSKISFYYSYRDNFKNLFKGDTKSDIPSSSSGKDEEMIDSEKEKSYSFRPHNQNSDNFGINKIDKNPIIPTFVENQIRMMKELYSLSDTESRYINFQGVYPRINYLQKSSPKEIRYWYDFGAINSIYLTAPDFPEISELPSWIMTSVKDCYLKNMSITPKDTLVIKLLSAGPDFYNDNTYPAYHFLQLLKYETFYNDFDRNRKNFQNFRESDIHYRRALGIRVILQGMEASFKRGFRTYSGNSRYSPVLITPAKETPQSAQRFLASKIDLLEKGILRSSPMAQAKLCEFRNHGKETCPACSRQKDKQEAKIISDDED